MKIEGEILHKALASLKSTYDTVCKAVAPHHDHVNGLEELNSIKPDVLSAIDNIYQLRAKDRHRDRTQRLVYDNISKIAQSIARFASHAPYSCQSCCKQRAFKIGRLTKCSK
eukprot:TRINITY_DN12450_c0_g1_i1.p1 TRINITY_DN12450_c0_g1~~TRINITY_DN12450_c0_g1_i1.p1  ORF type:complete len:112 (+),score=6.93 TRINITY_DN12450_c0_g1_i1:324-659(+)